MLFRRSNRGRWNGNKNFQRRRGNNRTNMNNNVNYTKESLDHDLENYMAQTKLDNDSNDMNTI